MVKQKDNREWVYLPRYYPEDFLPEWELLVRCELAVGRDVYVLQGYERDPWLCRRVN